MHGFEVELGSDIPTPDDIVKAISDHHRLTYGIPSPGTGHLFTLNVRSLPEPEKIAWPEIPDAWIEAARAQPSRLDGADGDVIVGEGWRIATATATHLVLRRRPDHE